MIGKVQNQDSFQSLRIRISESEYEPNQFGYSAPSSPGESLLPRDCQEYRTAPRSGVQTPTQDQQQPTARYKTEMCRPFQEHGTCKYGDKCQFAHGHEELRSVNRHPKYKTEVCRTYHSAGFCPYGPRCHFLHSMDEIRPNPPTPEKKSNTGVKQLPMFGGSSSTWSYPDTSSDMKQAVNQLSNFFNISLGARNLNSSGSSESSRSGSFCSDLDSPTSASPPPTSYSSPLEVSRNLRLPIFSKLA